MPPSFKGTKAGLVAGTAVLLISHATLAGEINVHVPTPSVHVHVPPPNVHTPIRGGNGSIGLSNGTGSPGVKVITGASSNGAGSLGAKAITGGSSIGTGSPGAKVTTGGSSNGAGSPGAKVTTGSSSNGTGSPSGKVITNADTVGGSSNGAGSSGVSITEGPLAGPLTSTPLANLAAGSGTPVSGPPNFYLTFYPVFFPFDDIARLLGDETAGAPTSVGGLTNSIENGSDDEPYGAVIAADLASVAAAQQAQTTAAACAVDPSLSGCNSAESVPQATANLANAENTYQDFYSDINYLLWLYSLMESGLPLPPGFSPAAATAVEAAVAACLASPSTCDSTIAQLETVLAELGVPSQVTIAGQTFVVLQSPSEIAGSAPFTVQPGSRQPSLTELLEGYKTSWGFIAYFVASG
jgi:hypothetical protein